MNTQEWRINLPLAPNFIMRFDDFRCGGASYVQFEFTVRKTILSRLKYWLFCQFFPFKIVKWVGIEY
uniref:Uncharacterized protein n=1 Tax=viral metagenome TaxID=1070528 RepID=A0A6M3IZK8_9ZZZZ